MALFYVSATDNLLSGWGQAVSKTSKFLVACNTEEQVEKTKKWMFQNTLAGGHVFSRIEVHKEKPYYPPSNYHVSIKHYDECNAIRNL